MLETGKRKSVVFKGICPLLSLNKNIVNDPMRSETTVDDEVGGNIEAKPRQSVRELTANWMRVNAAITISRHYCRAGKDAG